MSAPAISFCTTAMCRPDILDQCYSSFTHHLKDIDFSKTVLRINIDPAPNAGLTDVVISVAKKYFGCVITRTPSEPNFTKAVNWLWSSADTPYIFHLEDDWCLLRNTSVTSLINTLSSHPTWLQLILRAYKYKYVKFALSPSIMSQKLYSRFAGTFNFSLNPEIQFRVSGAKDLVGTSSTKVLVVDLGRSYLKKNRIDHPALKCNFTRWVFRK